MFAELSVDCLSACGAVDAVAGMRAELLCWLQLTTANAATITANIQTAAAERSPNPTGTRSVPSA
jgi:hypothetical protein